MALLELIREFIHLEEKHAEELRKLAERIEHPVLKALFIAISKDSEKHSLMYKSLYELLSSTQPFITENDLKTISTVIKKHIDTEARMLQEAKKLLDSINDPRVKLVLAAIADDELKHHELLKNIERKAAELETFTEELYWDMVWRESPWHGTPGG